VELDGGAQDRERFQEKMLQRFLTSSQPAGRDDVDYLLDRMDQLSDSLRNDAVVLIA
jgi:uncharacterized protein (DUF2336 family)